MVYSHGELGRERLSKSHATKPTEGCAKDCPSARNDKSGRSGRARTHCRAHGDFSAFPVEDPIGRHTHDVGRASFSCEDRGVDMLNHTQCEKDCAGPSRNDEGVLLYNYRSNAMLSTLVYEAEGVSTDGEGV